MFWQIWVRWLTLLLLLAAGTGLRFVCLVCKPFWFDECFSVEVARIAWPSFLRLLWWREANMALYYLLLRTWLHFGQSEFFIRSLSAVIAAATLPAIYWLARLLYNRRVALISTALLAFNAYSVRYAQETRSYALFLLLATISSAFLVRLLRAPTRRNCFGYVLFSILAVYTHFYALLLVLAHWLAVRHVYSSSDSGVGTIIRPGQMRRVWLTIGIASLPVLVFVAKTGAGPIRWIPRPGVHDLAAFYEHLAGGKNWALPLIYSLVMVAALLPQRRKLFARIQDWEVWRAQFLVIWLLFPVVLTLVLSIVRPVFLARYMIFCLPPLVILTAAGLTRLRQAWLLGIALAGILLLNLQGVLFVYAHDFDNERDASGAATHFVLDHAEPGDAIVFHIAETRIPYEFFRSRMVSQSKLGQAPAQNGPEILFPQHGASLDYRDFTGKPSQELLRSIGDQHRRAWIMLMNNGTPQDPDPTTVMITNILPQAFPQIQRWQFWRVEVRLYSK